MHSCPPQIRGHTSSLGHGPPRPILAGGVRDAVAIHVVLVAGLEEGLAPARAAAPLSMGTSFLRPPESIFRVLMPELVGYPASLGKRTLILTLVTSGGSLRGVAHPLRCIPRAGRRQAREARQARRGGQADSPLLFDCTLLEVHSIRLHVAIHIAGIAHTHTQRRQQPSCC